MAPVLPLRHGVTFAGSPMRSSLRSIHFIRQPTGSCFGASALIHHVPRGERMVAPNFVVAPGCPGDVAERGRKEARITYA